LGLAASRTFTGALAILVRIAYLLTLQLLAVPDLAIKRVDLAWCALTCASCPVRVLGEALGSRRLAALGVQARG